MITPAKRNIAILLGAGFWLIAALIVHFGHAVLDGGMGSVVMFAMAVPNAFFTLWVFDKVLRPMPGEIVPMVAWASLVALLLDGLAISFAPGIYAGETPATQYGAGLIMFGAGWILLIAMVRKL